MKICVSVSYTKLQRIIDRLVFCPVFYFLYFYWGDGFLKSCFRFFPSGIMESFSLENTFRISEFVNQAPPSPSLNCAILNDHFSFEEQKNG